MQKFDIPRIGMIKQAIFMFTEAIGDFEEVIALKEDFIPAMKGNTFIVYFL